MNFTNDTKTVVIGGTSGIGKAVVTALCKRPGTVVGASRSTGLDVTNKADIAAFFEAMGSIDHVIFTSGSAAPAGSISDVEIDRAKHAFDIKFWGAVAVAKSAASHIKPSGTITFTSGFLARRTVPGAYVKTAINASIEAVAKILAKELAPIRVNVISPGLTNTEAYAGMPEDSRIEMLTKAKKSLPAGKVGSASELATGYLFVIDNPFVTGAVIDIDGGSLIS